jgi:hypothetical protein
VCICLFLVASRCSQITCKWFPPQANPLLPICCLRTNSNTNTDTNSNTNTDENSYYHYHDTFPVWRRGAYLYHLDLVNSCYSGSGLWTGQNEYKPDSMPWHTWGLHMGQGKVIPAVWHPPNPAGFAGTWLHCCSIPLGFPVPQWVNESCDWIHVIVWKRHLIRASPPHGHVLQMQSASPNTPIPVLLQTTLNNDAITINSIIGVVNINVVVTPNILKSTTCEHGIAGMNMTLFARAAQRIGMNVRALATYMSAGLKCLLCMSGLLMDIARNLDIYISSSYISPVHMYIQSIYISVTYSVRMILHNLNVEV